MLKLDTVGTYFARMRIHHNHGLPLLPPRPFHFVHHRQLQMVGPTQILDYIDPSLPRLQVGSFVNYR